MNGKVNERQTNSVGGFSLAELLVSLGVTSLVMSALMVGVVSLGKSFRATELYSKSNSAQIRLIDAMAMDLRRAVAISITTSPDSNPTSCYVTSRCRERMDSVSSARPELCPPIGAETRPLSL